MTLKTANQSFRMTFWPTMLHQNTKFGDKSFCRWEDMVLTKIQWNSKPLLWPWPWAQHSNAVFSQDNPAYDNVPSNQSSVAKRSVVQIYSRKSYFGNMSLHSDLNLEDSKAIFFPFFFFLHDTLVHDGASPYQVWWETIQLFRRSCPDKHSLTFWSFPVTLTLNTASFFFISQGTVAYNKIQ